MTDQTKRKRPNYVVVAQVAAELNKTLESCRKINLTASNAQAASTRIGNAAMGFKVLTHFIDELATDTQRAAKEINELARQASGLSTDIARSQMALSQFSRAQQRLDSKVRYTAIIKAEENTRDTFLHLRHEFNEMVDKIQRKLEDLKKTLRTANALASVCRIEACRVDKQNQDTFIGVADKVDEVAEAIRQRVDTAITLFTETQQKEAA